jgi:hypothetical protein
MLQNKGEGTCLEFNLKDQPRENQDNYEWSHTRVTIGPCCMDVAKAREHANRKFLQLHNKKRLSNFN